MPNPIHGTFQSITGETLDKRLWLPEWQSDKQSGKQPANGPKAILQLVHGMAEHIDRYNETAQRLNEAGFIVVGHTHLGHGATAKLPGHFAKENGWDALVEDTHTLRQETTASYPGLPYFLLGHSMGSFVARSYSLKYAKDLKGLILSGTGHFDPVTLGGGKLIANLQCVFGMAEKPSKLLQAISSAGYNSKYTNPRTEFDWLTADESVVDAYLADPFCGFPFTARGYRDMFTGLAGLHPKALVDMDKDVPVYLFAGKDDPVGKYGEGVKKVGDEIRAAGVRDVTVTLYEGGRHEMFNEENRQEVWADLTGWMERVILAV